MPDLSQPFGPIAEGFNPTFVPEVGYVRQKGKVHFFFGDRALVESVDGSTTIVENFDDLELEERMVNGKTYKTVKNGAWFVEGPYQNSDKKNKNGRTYGKRIWERLIADSDSPVQLRVKARGMVGHLEHPPDGRMDGRQGALLTPSLKLRPNGVVWGVSELLDTPNGLILQEYTRKKIQWGVSSRGNGSVDVSGRVNEDDYMLETFDGVLRPSTPGAYPKPVGSSHESEPSGDSPEGSTQLSEEAQACLEQVTALEEVEVKALDASSRFKFTGELLSELGRVNSLERSQALSQNKASELQDWLLQKLGEAQEATAASAEMIVDGILTGTDLGDGDPEGSAFGRVVADLQQRVTDLAEETETLRAQASAAESQLQTARERIEALESERDAAAVQVQEANEALVNAQARLAVAEGVIVQQSTMEVEDATREAVEEAVRQVPGLERFRDVLEGASDPDRVLELAEELLPTMVAEDREDRIERSLPQLTKRHALPQRGVVVESEVQSGARAKLHQSSSRGARIAGKALKTMGPKKGKR